MASISVIFLPILHSPQKMLTCFVVFHNTLCAVGDIYTDPAWGNGSLTSVGNDTGKFKAVI